MWNRFTCAWDLFQKMALKILKYILGKYAHWTLAYSLRLFHSRNMKSTIFHHRLEDWNSWTKKCMGRESLYYPSARSPLPVTPNDTLQMIHHYWCDIYVAMKVVNWTLCIFPGECIKSQEIWWMCLVAYEYPTFPGECVKSSSPMENVIETEVD